MLGEEPFETPRGNVAAPGELVVDLDGYEGPIDVLLSLARDQKVDLTKISILQLADQYLAFISAARQMRLEIAADYLVMAAWLAYLKSRLLLPEPQPEDEPSGAELAAALAFQLQRLEAMQQAGVRLMARPLLGRDVFPRGLPEPVRVVRTRKYSDTLYDLLTAYSQQRVRTLGHRTFQMVRAPMYLIEEARARIEAMLGQIPSWSLITRFLPPGWGMGARRRSALASTFSAALELARDGKLEIRQMAPFAEIFLKDRPQGGEEVVS